ncbi:MAG: hypothetical protein Kow006_12670 [Gammaproteobacteria bacterium]
MGFGLADSEALRQSGDELRCIHGGSWAKVRHVLPTHLHISLRWKPQCACDPRRSPYSYDGSSGRFCTLAGC